MATDQTIDSIPPGSLSREAIKDLLDNSGGVAGLSGEIQYNNAGVPGAVAESVYIPGIGLILGGNGFSLGFAGGSNGLNTLSIGPGGLTIEALEASSTLQVDADSDITINSNNGTFAIAAQTGSFNSTGQLQFISTAGVIFFQSQLATPRYNFAGLPVFANNAAALAGGLHVGDLYRTGANPDPVCVVH